MDDNANSYNMGLFMCALMSKKDVPIRISVSQSKPWDKKLLDCWVSLCRAGYRTFQPSRAINIVENPGSQEVAMVTRLSWVICTEAMCYRSNRSKLIMSVGQFRSLNSIVSDWLPACKCWWLEILDTCFFMEPSRHCSTVKEKKNKTKKQSKDWQLECWLRTVKKTYT